MRTLSLILTVLAATLLISSAVPQDRVKPSHKQLIEESLKKVKGLQKERIATLKELADQITALYQSGHGSFEDVLDARLLVHKAELDATEKDSDRISLYKNFVDDLKKMETIADANVKAARALKSTFLKIKARRLQAEINLERSKLKENKEFK